MFRSVSAVVPMVDQEAVICFRDGIEVLAIRTRADTSGSGDEQLAWVVPVPGPDAPELLTCTDGVFGTARALTHPRLLLHSGPGLGWFLFFAALFLLAAVAALRANDGVPSRERSIMGVLVILFGFFCLVAVLLPSLAKARSSSGGPSGELVEVLKQERVGTLDVSVVRAKPGLDSAEALAAWLKQAGCTVPATVEPVLADYAARNWVFVAARMAHAKGTERLEPTPLVVRFPTASPVYPMKLTGVGNGRLELELVVLADGTATAPGMKTARSSPLLEGDAYYNRDAVPLQHEGLKALTAKVGGAGGGEEVRWISRLTGRLTPAQQTTDMTIQIEPGSRLGESLYTREGAASLGAEWGAGVAGLAIVALAIALCVRRFTKPGAWTLLAACGLLGFLTAFVTAASVATYSGQVRPSKSSYRAMRDIESTISSLGTHDIDSLRTAIAARRVANVEPYASLPPESDVPGGYTLREGDRGEVWIDLYNLYGVADRGYPLSILTR
jgi:uncharacterized membrane protein YhaH (DUF805 family)